MKKMFSITFYFALSINLLSAEDFGVRGHIFAIQEQDLLEYLKNRLNALSEEQYERLGEAISQRYVNKAKEPEGISLEEAKEYRLYYFDPTITTSLEILDHQGRLIAPKGERVNPLSKCSLSQDLLFLDGSKESHLKWAREQLARWILVKGQPLELEVKKISPSILINLAF